MKFTLTPLAYEDVRLRWCRAELLRFMKRWGIYIVIGLTVLGSSGSTGLGATAGMLALAISPLFRAATQPIGIALLASLAHSLLGGAVVLALRPLLWSRAWAESESALPLGRASFRRSDLQVTLLALTPLAAVYGAGATTWIVSGASWIAPVRILALSMLVMSLAGSVVWGMLVLHFARRPLTRTSNRIAKSSKPATITFQPPCRSVIWMLLALPLVRGPALRVGRLLVIALTVVLASCAAMVRWPDMVGWFLAGYAVLGLSITTRLSDLINAELAPLHDACAPLPINTAHLLRARQALALLPPTLALVFLSATGWWMQADLYAAPLVGYLTVNWVFNGLVVAKTLKRDEGKASNDAALWLLMLVIVLAFASEVGQ